MIDRVTIQRWTTTGRASLRAAAGRRRSRAGTRRAPAGRGCGAESHPSLVGRRPRGHRRRTQRTTCPTPGCSATPAAPPARSPRSAASRVSSPRFAARSASEHLGFRAIVPIEHSREAQLRFEGAVAGVPRVSKAACPRTPPRPPGAAAGPRRAAPRAPRCALYSSGSRRGARYLERGTWTRCGPRGGPRLAAPRA